MTNSKAERPASEVYEIVIQELAQPAGVVRSVFDRLVAIMLRNPSGPETNPVIVTVARKDNGREVFRHIDDDLEDSHVLAGLEHDLATLTASELAAKFSS